MGTIFVFKIIYPHTLFGLVNFSKQFPVFFGKFGHFRLDGMALFKGRKHIRIRQIFRLQVNEPLAGDGVKRLHRQGRLIRIRRAGRIALRFQNNAFAN